MTDAVIASGPERSEGRVAIRRLPWAAAGLTDVVIASGPERSEGRVAIRRLP